MISIFFKATGIWLIIVVAAIINGVLREKLLVPIVGAHLALPLNGVFLSGLVLFVSFLLIPFLKSSETYEFLLIGLLWVALTLCFEFGFGHLVAGKSWQEIIQVFNLKKGDLFLLVLTVTAISPWVSAKLRGIL